MNPLIALIIGELAKQVPTLAIEIMQILTKEKYTDADWDALKAKYSGKTYDQYIAEAPPCTPPTPTT